MQVQGGCWSSYGKEPCLLTQARGLPESFGQTCPSKSSLTTPGMLLEPWVEQGQLKQARSVYGTFTMYP
jgi:hypothetical protein